MFILFAEFSFFISFLTCISITLFHSSGPGQKNNYILQLCLIARSLLFQGLFKLAPVLLCFPILIFFLMFGMEFRLVFHILLVLPHCILFEVGSLLGLRLVQSFAFDLFAPFALSTPFLSCSPRCTVLFILQSRSSAGLIDGKLDRQPVFSGGVELAPAMRLPESTARLCR